MNLNNIRFSGTEQSYFNKNKVERPDNIYVKNLPVKNKEKTDILKTESGTLNFLKKLSDAAAEIRMQKIRAARVAELNNACKKTSENTSIYNNYSKKLDYYKINNIEEKPLKYTKAKNIEEAKKYAANVLGISRFAIDDLETANQINYSITKAYNKTHGEIGIPDEVEYADIQLEKGSNLKMCPAQVQVHSKEGKITKYVLQINKDIYKRASEIVQENLSEYARNGQIVKNAKGQDCLELVCGYRYSDTLNRYLRLYGQGKLTPKALVDFEQLLAKAKEEEDLILTKRNALTDILKKRCNTDISKMSNDEYKDVARQYLLKLRREQNIIHAPHCQDIRHMHSASGLDGYILHELGHILHINEIGLEGLRNNIKNHKYGKNMEDLRTALTVSLYAGTNANEGVAEIIAGLLSNDKYPQDVINLLKKYMPKTKIF